MYEGNRPRRSAAGLKICIQTALRCTHEHGRTYTHTHRAADLDVTRRSNEDTCGAAA